MEHPLTYEALARQIFMQLPYEPNTQQSTVLVALARFLMPLSGGGEAGAPSADRAFVLRGYAGTGKTTMVGALVRTLQALNVPVVLMAPTGRAAKVFAAYAQAPAFTIHRKIYQHFATAGGGKPPLQDNRLRGAVFIVDEASMIAGAEQGDSLLDDLIHYVYGGQDCRLILMGDTAQLPPVGCTASPAMDADVLRRYGLRVSQATLTHPVRQEALGGILYNATWMRQAMRQTPAPKPQLWLDNYNDVTAITGDDLPEILDRCYRNEGIDDTILITRSNQRATLFNRAIRTEILYHEETVCQGDLLLVAKNNYFWPTHCRTKGLDFLANGDIVRVEEVYGTEMRYGCIFADLRVRLMDGGQELDCKILTEPLLSDTPAMPGAELTKLYQRIITDPQTWDPDLPLDLRSRQMQRNPYWNALQMKYAYAVTCHKAQGGQWSNVIVDMGYIPPDAIGLEFYRWLYTATTRARKHLWYLNPDMR